MKTAAFFDLDKTLMAGSSGMQFARVAARQGIVSRRQLAEWGWDHLRYRLRGATDEETADVLKVARELITGVPGKDIDRMGPEVMAAILPRIYPLMLEEIWRHQDEGRPCFIVSAAGNGIVESLAAVLGMEGGIGTRYELGPDGTSPASSTGPSSTDRARSRRWSALPRSTRSTWPAPSPTRTRSPTCRCCGPSATPWWSIPTPSWRGSPARRAGR